MLRLAALSLRRASDPAAFVQRLGHSSDRSMSRYLLEEVLAHLAPAAQELLVRTAILEQFCAELCRAVLGTETSQAQVQATLDWLERSDLFLIPLDERQGWYRFHHLFQQLLQQRLQERLSQEELSALHGRASAWYAEQGLIDEALHHALAAGDASYAVRLVEAHFRWAFEQRRLLQMEHWLRLVPQEQTQSSPGLLLAWAWVMQARGQLGDFQRLLMAAGRLVATRGSEVPDQGDPPNRILRALTAILWSHFQFTTGQVQASLESARSALQWLGPDEAHIASHALYHLAQAYQATGHEELAQTTLNKALRELPVHLSDTARLLFAQATLYLRAGKLHQVEQTARHLLRLAQDADLALNQNYAHWQRGVVQYEWNNLDAAVYHLSSVIANRHCAHFWAVRDAMCGLALAYHAQGLGKEAQESMQALLDWAQEQHNLPQLLTAYAFFGRLALGQDDVEKASQWLELAGEQEGLGPMLFFEDPTLTRAWMLLAKGDAASVAQGQALLTHLLWHVEAIHSTRKTITVLALQAWAYDLQGYVTKALDVLERALALARPGGFLRTFADVPQLSKVLQELRRRRKAQQVVDNQLDAYLQRILVAMNSTPAPAGSTQALVKQEGLEPLTERELHILGLLDKDLTNKEMARELVVTPGTVKVHTHNLYRKLSVNNRRAAVTLAKALGLVAR
jgi:LuxR family maltose regulon positive regulatory protein